MNILSLDCATKTGWSTLINGNIESGMQDFSKRRGESNGMLFLRFNQWLRDMVRLSGKFDLVVYEQAHHRGGAATEIGVGLMTRAQEFAAETGAEYTTYHTATIKKRIAGYGKASKEDMMAWFNRTTGRKPIDDNEADARAILELAIKDFSS
jgi:Holliday junction resolvasome RuvABC endonuclease subunit